MASNQDMEALRNHDNIEAWSAYSREMIELVGDAGCGTGYLCHMLAKRGARVTGIEPATSLFLYAVEREQVESLGIHYLQQDLSTFTSSHAAFDIVIANMVFMDIPDYEVAMHNCIAVLKSD